MTVSKSLKLRALIEEHKALAQNARIAMRYDPEAEEDAIYHDEEVRLLREQLEAMGHRPNPKPRPLDPVLYEEVKAEIRSKVRTWPSAYASGLVVKEYKARGGKYAGERSKSAGLGKWFGEEWVDLSRPKSGGGFEPCGRPSTRMSEAEFRRTYPKCVPKARAERMTPDQIADAVARKKQAELRKPSGQKRPEYVRTNPTLARHVDCEALGNLVQAVAGSNEAFALLDAEELDSFQTGGCAVLAAAVEKVFGLQQVTVGSDVNDAEHIANYCKDGFVDSDGWQTKEQLFEKLDMESSSPRRWRVRRGVADHDFVCPTYLVEEVAALLEDHAPRKNPMKQVEDLSGFRFAVMEHQKAGAMKGRLVIAFYDDEEEKVLGWMAALPKSFGRHELEAVGLPKYAVASHPEEWAWEVAKVHTWQDGWGPLLYEAMLALLVQKGYSGWLFNDPHCTSTEARAVWRRFENRDDIEFVDLESGQAHPRFAMRALPELLEKRHGMVKKPDTDRERKRKVKAFLKDAFDQDDSGFYGDY